MEIYYKGQEADQESSLKELGIENFTITDKRFNNLDGEFVIKYIQPELIDKFKKIKGPIIEIGGPTRGGYEYLSNPILYLWNIDIMTVLKNSGKHIFISNLFPYCPSTSNVKNGKYIKKEKNEKVDFQANGKQMPLADNTISAIFCSCIGDANNFFPSAKKHNKKNKNPSIETTILCQKIIKEIQRLLINGGLVFWQGYKKNDLINFNHNFSLIYQTSRLLILEKNEQGGQI